MPNVVLRKCQGCAKVCDRAGLIKITLNCGKLYINPSSKILGRSVYICKDIECVKAVIKKHRLNAALKFKNFEETAKAEEELLKLFSGTGF